MTFGSEFRGFITFPGLALRFGQSLSVCEKIFRQVSVFRSPGVQISLTGASPRPIQAIREWGNEMASGIKTAFDLRDGVL